jgi:hypothetical protein
MNPTYGSNSLEAQIQQRRRMKQIIAAVIVLVVVYVVYTLFHSLQFHVVSTDPSTGSFAAVAPYMDINFNEPLKKDGISVSASSGIVTSSAVVGKTLRLTLNEPLQAGQQYTITIKSISSTKGSQITNKTFAFTAKDISFQKLSDAQQKATLAKQVKRPASRDNFAYVGDDAMTSEGGLSAEQLLDAKQAIFQYIQANKLTDKVSTIAFTNIVSAAPHPDDPLAPDVMSFTLGLDQTTYKAKLSLSDLFTARLFLYDTSGAQVYDSGDIKLSSN